MEAAGADLSFVNLGITIQNLPSSVTMFGFQVAFYGIIIGLGMLVDMAMAFSDTRRRGQDPDIYLDFALYGTIFSIIGARAYYVIFDQDNHKDDLLQIFNLRGDGLAIYDGVIGVVVTLTVFTRTRKMSFSSMTDNDVLGLITGQIIGRQGNFFNYEAFGGFINNLFAMRIKKGLVNPSVISQQLIDNEIVENGVTYIQVRPTFLHGSVWSLCVLGLMFWYRKHKEFEGEMLWMHLLGYGLGRVWIGGSRTGQLKFPGSGLTVSQLLSTALILTSTGIVIYKHHGLEKGEEVGGDFPSD